ncbi:MAG: DUF2808 domain-containing protein [Cyanothece sp. SIO1E1]|nr:DUF2808 domain-containing protein [Cyanothece sp. SIO1E1]
MQRVLSYLAIAGCLMVGLPFVSRADGLPGLTIFSGVERNSILNFRLDYGGRPGVRDRYHLRIPSKKMELAVSDFRVTYPDTYDGKFDPERVQVRFKGERLKLGEGIEEVSWDEDNRVIEIFMEQPVPARTKVELVLSNVRNPRFPGVHYFNCNVNSPGDIPLPRYLGTWIISIGRQ